MREHWSSKVGFLLAAVGSAVGLGVLWKFPYTVGQNGGGLFLIAYFICIACIGVPLLIGELAIGRHSQRAAIGAFASLGKRGGWQIGGYLGAFASLLIMAFYSVIAGWGMSYIVMSLTGLYADRHRDIGALFSLLSSAGGITLLWTTLFIAITVGIVSTGVRQGVEKWSKLMTRALFVLLLILLVNSLRLPGLGAACDFLFRIDPAGFTFSSGIEALGLAFFTLSLGQGIMISYGSYLRRDTALQPMALVIGAAVIVAAILAALTIFPVIFTFGLAPEAGQGLIFQTLPYLFASLPGALILSTLFFILFVFTALTSAIPFIEVVATNLMEQRHLSRHSATFIAGGISLLIAIPCALSGSGALFPNWASIYGMTFIESIEAIVFVWLVPLAGLATSLFIGWGVRAELLKGEWGGRPLFLIWRAMLRYIIPITIFLIILQKSGIIDIDTWF